MAYKRRNDRKYREYDNRRDNRNISKKPSPKIPKSRRPSHVTVVAKNNEDPNRTVKRFLKKCKNEKIVEKFREKTFYVKPSEKRRKERMRRKRTIERAQSEQD